jgi:hypothetical protein
MCRRNGDKCPAYHGNVKRIGQSLRGGRVAGWRWRGDGDDEKEATAVVRVLMERSAYSSMPSKRADFLRAIKFFSGGVG